MVLLLAVLLGPALHGSRRAIPDANADRVVAVDVQALARSPGVIPVEVGVHIENFHHLDLRNRSFVAEGYYWLKWTQQLQTLIDQGIVQVANIAELTNQSSTWDSKIELDGSAPRRLPDGRWYQLFRFSAGFYIPSVNLRHSPFDAINLPLVIEIKPDILALQNRKALLLPDSNARNGTDGGYSAMDGYSLGSIKTVASLHSYGTDWGLGQGSLRYSQVSVESLFQAKFLPNFVNWILPLLIVFAIVVLAPSLAPEMMDVRLAIPSTGLLTMIFLQQTYKANLPPMDGLSFLDVLYAYAYLVSIFTFALFLWSSNLLLGLEGVPLAAARLRITRMDRRFQGVSVLGLALVAVLAWFSASL
jgi:hypothetical protein